MVVEKIKQLHKRSLAILMDLFIDHFLLLLEESELNSSDKRTINIEQHEQIIKMAENICNEIDLKVLQKLF